MAKFSCQDLKSKEGCGPEVRNRRDLERNRISSFDNVERSGLFQI